MTGRAFQTIAVVLALLTLASSAAARPAPPREPVKPALKRRIVGILSVQVQGVPKEIAAQFENDLEKQLDSKAYWLAPRSRIQEMMENSTRWTSGCVVGKCLSEVRTQTAAELVLLAAITGSNTSFGYVVTLVRTDTGDVVAQAMDRCDVCTVSEALGSATRAAVNLVTAVPEMLPDEATANSALIERERATHAATTAALESRQRRGGIVLTVVGLAAAATGAALYWRDDKRPSYALATLAAGGGVAAGGLITLAF